MRLIDHREAREYEIIKRENLVDYRDGGRASDTK